MQKRAFILLILIVALILTCACGGSPQNGSTSDNNRVYDDVMALDNVQVEEAYDRLKDINFTDEERKAGVDRLKRLMDCSGQFVQVSEGTGNRYNATVSFYLSMGKIYCSVDYTNYAGELADGEVFETTEPDYLFESSPKGSFLDRDQVFKIWFGKEKLHITWAEGICDYVLTRGNGSVDEVQDSREPFEESIYYRKIEEILDQSMAAYNHGLSFDKENKTLSIYIEAPESTKIYLAMKNQELMDAWEGVCDSMAEMDENMTTLATMDDRVKYVDLYMVDKYKKNNVYTDDDIIVWIRNGEEKYNYANESSYGKSSQGNTNSSTSQGNNNLSFSPSTGTSSATSGEKNALRTAKDYLSVMAFSYNGLIEQLEYEGYSYSEAVYAVDHCGADWKEQAAKKAKEYLDVMPFSRSELIEQLEYEGFTYSQAEYGVNKVY